MELDKETPGLHTSGGPQTNHTKLDYPPRFPTLAASEREAAVLWIVAHFVHYRLLSQRRLSLQDYMDFMDWVRWKLYQQALSPRPTGRYLEVIDWPQY